MRTHLNCRFRSDVAEQLAAYDITEVTVRYCGECAGCLVLTVEEREIPRHMVKMA